MDKRRRNARPSKYRPRTEAQKRRRQELWAARADTRAGRKATALENDLTLRLRELEDALRDQGRDGVHGRRHVRPLDEIQDDAERLAILKARVERLEALWSIDKRKRETRGKIIIGGALLAEAIDAVSAGEPEVLTGLLDVLDRRVTSPRDRMTLRELLGNAPLPLKPALYPSGDFAGEAPEFDALVHSAMAEEEALTPSGIDADYADIDASWTAEGYL